MPVTGVTDSRDEHVLLPLAESHGRDESFRREHEAAESRRLIHELFASKVYTRSGRLWESDDEIKQKPIAGSVANARGFAP